MARRDRDIGGREKRRGSNIISNLLVAVGVVLLIVAGGIYVKNETNYRQIDETNERVAEYAKLTDDAERPPEIDWDGLKAMNPDVVGWLQVPGTIINYPVFHAGNNEVYLNRAPDGSYSIGGSVFMDFENKVPGMDDPQTIIYGHHMRNGSQFKQIADMDKQEYFDGVKLIWYVTEKGAYDLVPLFLYYTFEGDLDVRQFTFESANEFHKYLNTYFAKAVTKRADAQQIIDQAEHVLTLSTCNYYDGFGRTLLVCVPRNEVPGTPQYEAAEPERAARRAEEKRKEEEARKAEAKRKAEEAKRKAEEKTEAEIAGENPEEEWQEEPQLEEEQPQEEVQPTDVASEPVVMIGEF